jgi:hypothetical protein
LVRWSLCKHNKERWSKYLINSFFIESYHPQESPGYHTTHFNNEQERKNKKTKHYVFCRDFPMASS